MTGMITDRNGRHEVLLQINQNRYNFQENKCNLFCEKAFNSKNPNFGKVSQAQTQSYVTTSSILENPQFGRVSVCWYGYCDKF